MTVSLIVQADVVPMSWESFLEKYPAFSISLDGFVSDSPKYAFADPGPSVNFNHHEHCDRLATRATCSQVLMAIRQGLFKLFRDQNGPKANIYVNDCDEDVCLSWFLLKNSHLVSGAINPLINRLVTMEDALDCTAGAYPYPSDLPVLQELAWIFEPYRTFRVNGGVERKNNSEFKSVICDVENRIMKHITGSGDSVPLDSRYEVIGGGPNWSMVKEIGSQARNGMFSDGIQTYISVRERSNNRWTYTIGKLSSFIPFNLSLIFDELNKIDSNGDDKWGGSNTVGGSPRVNGSKLNPKELQEIINSTLRK